MPKFSNRRVSNDVQLTRLEQRHARLKAEVAALDKKIHLSSPEEVRLQQLKKEKLYTKDEIRVLLRSS